jgi:hypothetical protein
VKELIALAKARPGQLSFGSAGLGSQNHLAMELFKYMTATNMVHIPYKATTIGSHRRVDRTHRSHGGSAARLHAAHQKRPRPRLGSVVA